MSGCCAGCYPAVAGAEAVRRLVAERAGERLGSLVPRALLAFLLPSEQQALANEKLPELRAWSGW